MSRPSDERHTPGPWHISQEPPRWIIQADAPIGKKAVCFMVGDYIECAGNAGLIAAAPEMLEALRLVAKGLRSKHIKDQTLIDSKSDGPEARLFTLSSVVFAAIAKVKGLAHTEGEGR